MAAKRAEEPCWSAEQVERPLGSMSCESRPLRRGASSRGGEECGEERNRKGRKGRKGPEAKLFFSRPLRSSRPLRFLFPSVDSFGTPQRSVLWTTDADDGGVPKKQTEGRERPQGRKGKTKAISPPVPCAPVRSRSLRQQRCARPRPLQDHSLRPAKGHSFRVASPQTRKAPHHRGLRRY